MSNIGEISEYDLVLEDNPTQLTTDEILELDKKNIQIDAIENSRESINKEARMLLSAIFNNSVSSTEIESLSINEIESELQNHENNKKMLLLNEMLLKAKDSDIGESIRGEFDNQMNEQKEYIDTLSNYPDFFKTAILWVQKEYPSIQWFKWASENVKYIETENLGAGFHWENIDLFVLENDISSNWLTQKELSKLAKEAGGKLPDVNVGITNPGTNLRNPLGGDIDDMVKQLPIYSEEGAGLENYRPSRRSLKDSTRPSNYKKFLGIVLSIMNMTQGIYFTGKNPSSNELGQYKFYSTSNEGFVEINSLPTFFESLTGIVDGPYGYGRIVKEMKKKEVKE